MKQRKAFLGILSGFSFYNKGENLASNGETLLLEFNQYESGRLTFIFLYRAYQYTYLLALNLTTFVFIMRICAFLLGRKSSKTAFRSEYWQRKALTGGEVKITKHTGFHIRFHKNAEAK